MISYFKYLSSFLYLIALFLRCSLPLLSCPYEAVLFLFILLCLPLLLCHNYQYASGITLPFPPHLLPSCLIILRFSYGYIVSQFFIMVIGCYHGFLFRFHDSHFCFHRFPVSFHYFPWIFLQLSWFPPFACMISYVVTKVISSSSRLIVLLYSSFFHNL